MNEDLNKVDVIQDEGLSFLAVDCEQRIEDDGKTAKLDIILILLSVNREEKVRSFDDRAEHRLLQVVIYSQSLQHYQDSFEERWLDVVLGSVAN